MYGTIRCCACRRCCTTARTIIESDHIARYVVARFDAADRLRVRSEDVDDMNRLAVMNGIHGERGRAASGKARRARGHRRRRVFSEVEERDRRGLQWLDAHVDVKREGFDYRDVVLVCMWQHLAHYGFVPLEAYARVRARVDRFAPRASVSSTTPAQSVRDAEAAGWKPEEVAPARAS